MISYTPLGACLNINSNLQITKYSVVVTHSNIYILCLTLDIFNVYNRRDILMRVYNMYEKENQTIVEDFRLLPIIPTLSFEIKF